MRARCREQQGPSAASRDQAGAWGPMVRTWPQWHGAEPARTQPAEDPARPHLGAVLGQPACPAGRSGAAPTTAAATTAPATPTAAQPLCPTRPWGGGWEYRPANSVCVLFLVPCLSLSLARYYIVDIVDEAQAEKTKVTLTTGIEARQVIKTRDTDSRPAKVRVPQFQFKTFGKKLSSTSILVACQVLHRRHRGRGPFLRRGAGQENNVNFNDGYRSQVGHKDWDTDSRPAKVRVPQFRFKTFGKKLRSRTSGCTDNVRTCLSAMANIYVL